MATPRTRSLRHSARFAAVAAAGALLLAACGGSSNSSSTTSASGSPTNLAGSSIKVFTPVVEAGKNYYQEMADAYMKAFPDRKVVVSQVPNDGYAQALRTQLQGGTAADVFYVTPGDGNPQALLPLVEAGFVESLQGTTADTTIPDSSLPNLEKDGQLYGQGLDLTVVAAVANQTAQKKNSYTEPADFSALLAACPAVAAKGNSAYVLAGAMPPNTGLFAMTLSGSRVYKANPNWNQDRTDNKTTFAGTQEWVDTLNAVLEMQKAGCFQKGVEGGDFAAITQGLARGTSFSAFIPSGAAFGLAQEAPGNTFAVTPMPGKTSSDTTVFVSINNAFSVNAASQNKDASKAFLAWLAEPAQLKTFAGLSGNLPAGKTIETTGLPPQYAPVTEFLSSGNFIPLPNQGWANGETYDALGKGVQGLLTGQATVQQVLESMDTAWNSGS